MSIFCKVKSCKQYMEQSGRKRNALPEIQIQQKENYFPKVYRSPTFSGLTMNRPAFCRQQVYFSQEVSERTGMGVPARSCLPQIWRPILRSLTSDVSSNHFSLTLSC
uniref:Uncharacterized protein n=1 Tax=Pyxicephalus adspersus TaxID=30357 RepID=A0AAV2ZVV6_PYXAD|nr:TPA: hypothetical protein GDO54_003177 [Pyxicephalus adspersus]